MGLLVIGQTGQVVEHLVTLAALVDRAGPVTALVQQELSFALEDGVTLETGVAPGGARLQGAGFFLITTRLILQVYSFS